MAGVSTKHIIKYADYTTVVGLSDNDKSAYKLTVVQFTACCRFHNLALNVDKTKEMMIDFRRDHADH